MHGKHINTFSYRGSAQKVLGIFYGLALKCADMKNTFGNNT